MPGSLRLQGLGGRAGMPWAGGDGATGTWLQRSRGRRQNSQAVIRGQAVAEEGTVLVFHLCKPGGKTAGLRHVQRHPERLLSAPKMQQPCKTSLQDPMAATQRAGKRLSPDPSAPQPPVVPGAATCWQSARSGSGCQRAAASGRRLGCKRHTLVSEDCSPHPKPGLGGAALPTPGCHGG